MKIVLELNEICPGLLDRYGAQGLLPAFSALRPDAARYVTQAKDEDLEPWVQWVTLHTGQPQTEHGVRRLDEGHRVASRRLWDRTAESGQDTLVFGSMNGDAVPSSRLSLLPDFWASGVQATDDTLAFTHRFLSAQVSEHVNPAASIGKADALRFAGLLARNGLSARTAALAAVQLARERTGGTDSTWHRACVLDQIQWDVFRHRMKRENVETGFFFANSVAYLQHRYWRHVEPEAYARPPTPEAAFAYGDAVPTGYRRLDGIVRQARDMVGPDGTLIIVSALSQQANTAYEEIGGKFVYRAYDFAEVLDWIGLEPVSVRPVMTHEALATFTDAESAKEARDRLLSLKTLAGEPVFIADAEGNRVAFQCRFVSEVADDLVIVGPRGERLFADLFSLVGEVNASKHAREGVFWIIGPGATPGDHGTIDLLDANGLMRDALGIPA